MKNWIGSFLPRRPGMGAARVAAEDVTVQVHYTDSPRPEVIENFKIGGSTAFFLTFLEGGTVDLNLEHVKDISFQERNRPGAAGDAQTSGCRVKVALRNGRVLEGYSTGLGAFSGFRNGIEWTFPDRHGSAGQTAQNSLARITVRGTRRA